MNSVPHGGKLVDVMVRGEALEALRKEAATLRTWILTPRQECDLEMILNGGFSPLTGFLTEAEYNGVVNDVHLPSGVLWPMPITLDVDEKFAGETKDGERVALTDSFHNLLAVITVESNWTPDKAVEGEKVFGSPDDVCHPAIDYLLNEAGSRYLGGRVEGVQLPIHYDYTLHRRTPAEVRTQFEKLYWTKVVGFQTRNPMHRSHRELTLLAARDTKANVLIHPVVGMTKPGDVDHYTRVRCYLEIIKTYPPGMAMVSLLPIAMRMAGPREAVWHALIRKNYGCTHFVVGRDHAGPGKNRAGESFYDPYAAQEMCKKYKDELGIEIRMYKMVVFVEEMNDYKQIDEVPEGMRVLSISGTELRRRLFKGIDIPAWFSYPQVVSILRQRHPPCNTQGFTIFLTGLSGSGKSTIASALQVALLEDGGRPVTLLDSSEIRKHLNAELGFSDEERYLNVTRIGWVASLITKNRGVAIVAAVSPARDARDESRRLVESAGGAFVEVHLNAPLETCEARDKTGFYKRARAGEIKGVAGIDHEYEAPAKPEVTIDTSKESVRQSVHEIILWLEANGYLSRPGFE